MILKDFGHHIADLRRLVVASPTTGKTSAAATFPHIVRDVEAPDLAGPGFELARRHGRNSKEDKDAAVFAALRAVTAEDRLLLSSRWNMSLAAWIPLVRIAFLRHADLTLEIAHARDPNCTWTMDTMKEWGIARGDFYQADVLKALCFDVIYLARGEFVSDYIDTLAMQLDAARKRTFRGS